jgi:cytochrome P450
MIPPSLVAAVPVSTPPMSEALRDERRRRFPIGASVTLPDLEDFDRSTRLLALLREREPVTWVEAVPGWLVTPRSLVEEVLSSHDRFTVRAESSLVRLVLGDHMLTHDGELHRHERAPYDPPFRLRPVRASYTGLIERLVADLLGGLEGAAGSELRAAYANPLAIRVAGGLLGLTFEEIGQIAEIYDTFATSMVDYSDPFVEATTSEPRRAFGEIVQRNIDRIRRAPDASVISSVVNAECPEMRRSDEDVIANVRIILFGAIETVTSIILSTTWALLSHPEQLAAVTADPSQFASAVNETLRWIPPVGFSERWAADDTELAGASIRRGEMMMPSMTAANRDPDFFPDPDRFDVSRRNARHHASFSHGEHHCIGFNVANLEARIAVERLFERFPSIALDPDRPSVPVGFGFRSPRELAVRWAT